MSKLIGRRTVLRGLLDGVAVSVGLPLFQCLLNDSGTALASGRPLPVRFGTWFWGLGTNKIISSPSTVGAGYTLPGELEPLQALRDYLNVYSNYRVSTDGRSNLCHYTGWVILRCGQAPEGQGKVPGESIDVTVADQIGGGTRFGSLEMTATGDRKDSFSFRSAVAVNPPEVSPVALYQRIFGPEFQDPNSPDFRPNSRVVLRKSVLSGVLQEGNRLRKSLGTEDRARLDQYFTSLRSLEQRLELQLQKPPRAEACSVPIAPQAELPVGLDWELVRDRHRLMTDILVHALACNQTRVFNMAYSDSFAATNKQGVSSTHHVITHEEQRNEHGYQETHSWFVRRALDELAYLIKALASVREGDSSLLYNTLLFAHSDHSTAQTHAIDGIPMMTAGQAGGQLRSGVHVDGKNQDEATRVGLTLLRAMGLKNQEWGRGSMRTSKVIEDVLV